MLTVNPMTRSEALTLDSRGRFTRKGWRRVTRFSISIRHPLRLIPGSNYARGKLSLSCSAGRFSEKRDKSGRRHALCRRQATFLHDAGVAAEDAVARKKTRRLMFRAPFP